MNRYYMISLIVFNLYSMDNSMPADSTTKNVEPENVQPDQLKKECKCCKHNHFDVAKKKLSQFLGLHKSSNNEYVKK